MIKTEVTGSGGNQTVAVLPTPLGGALVAIPPYKQMGVFKSATRAAAGTTIITSPNSGGSIVLTDLIVTAEKRGAGGTLTIRFTDGTNTINVAVVDVTDSPANFGVSFEGKWQGWTDARLEMVTDQAFDTTISCGYFKVLPKFTCLYAAWDALR